MGGWLEKLGDKLGNIVDRAVDNMSGDGRTKKCLEELEQKGITALCNQAGQQVHPIGLPGPIPWTKDDITPRCLELFKTKQGLSPENCKKPQAETQDTNAESEIVKLTITADNHNNHGDLDQAHNTEILTTLPNSIEIQLAEMPQSETQDTNAEFEMAKPSTTTDSHNSLREQSQVDDKEMPPALQKPIEIPLIEIPQPEAQSTNAEFEIAELSTTTDSHNSLREQSQVDDKEMMPAFQKPIEMISTEIRSELKGLLQPIAEFIVSSKRCNDIDKIASDMVNFYKIYPQSPLHKGPWEERFIADIEVALERHNFDPKAFDINWVQECKKMQDMILDSCKALHPYNSDMCGGHSEL